MRMSQEFKQVETFLEQCSRNLLQQGYMSINRGMVRFSGSIDPAKNGFRYEVAIGEEAIPGITTVLYSVYATVRGPVQFNYRTVDGESFQNTLIKNPSTMNRAFGKAPLKAVYAPLWAEILQGKAQRF